MYHISETKLDTLVQEADAISRRLLIGFRVPGQDVQRFGAALLEVETEMHKQFVQTPQQQIEMNFGTA